MYEANDLVAPVWVRRRVSSGGGGGGGGTISGGQLGWDVLARVLAGLEGPRRLQNWWLSCPFEQMESDKRKPIYKSRSLTFRLFALSGSTLPIVVE